MAGMIGNFLMGMAGGLANNIGNAMIKHSEMAYKDELETAAEVRRANLKEQMENSGMMLDGREINKREFAGLSDEDRSRLVSRKQYDSKVAIDQHEAQKNIDAKIAGQKPSTDYRIAGRIASEGLINQQLAINEKADAAEAAANERRKWIADEYEDVEDTDSRPDATQEYEQRMAAAGPNTEEAGMIAQRKPITSSKEAAAAAKLELAESRLEQQKVYQGQLIELQKAKEEARASHDKAKEEKYAAEIKLIEARAERALADKKTRDKSMTDNQISVAVDRAERELDRQISAGTATVEDYLYANRKLEKLGAEPRPVPKALKKEYEKMRNDISTANNAFSAGIIGSFAETKGRPTTSDGPTVENAAAARKRNGTTASGGKYTLISR